jgi:hypothetical protein
MSSIAGESLIFQEGTVLYNAAVLIDADHASC